ncbi:Rv3654c family TadE-like protein [Bifidobacterium avesanii]|uniref:Rv3654c family TadE-like protein n=1 Tax=Bifidobacterium avesanii TaxID=1798157 RepID=UPI0012665C68|nr:Rv3654c family TadE-like protein [Bifidobacterium avesanii]KAB8294402.1 pilus assembly protein TadE [Bifidobacterium avesanii]
MNARSKTWAAAADRGSMTVAGAALVMLAAVLLCTVAAVGRLMLCQSRAGTASESAALAVARAYDDGRANPCAVAGDAVRAHGARLVSCTVGDGDAAVVAAVDTGLPVMPAVAYESRAGPELCG